MLHLLLGCAGLTIPLLASKPASSLAGVALPRVSDGDKIDLGDALVSTSGRTILVLGTHAADFNAIEYGQRVRAYWPRLQARINFTHFSTRVARLIGYVRLQSKGIDRCMMVVNSEAKSCEKLAELL